MLLNNLKISLENIIEKKYKLVNGNGQTYLSSVPGTLAGNKRLKIYGELNCSSANRWIEKGGYVQNRVFFADEKTAIDAGYRPCGVCMKEKYKEWKEAQRVRKNERKK